MAGKKPIYVGVYISDDWLCRVKKWSLKKIIRVFLDEKLGNAVCFATALPGENGFFGTFDVDNKNAMDAIKLCKKENIRFMTVCSLVRPAVAQLLETEYKDLFIGSQALNERSTFLGLNWERRKPELAALFAKHPDGFEPQFSPTPEPVRCDDFQGAHDAFLRWITEEVEHEKARGIKTVCSVEAGVQHSLFYRAGIELEGAETMVYPVDPMLASLRGAARAYGKKEFMAFPAVGWYGGSECDPAKPGRLKLALYYAFMYGATHIFNESDIFCPTRKIPKSFDDPICVKTRKVIRSFYRFARKEPRPDTLPKTRIAFVQGYLDSWAGAGKTHDEGILWGQEQFKAGSAEKSWDLLDIVFPNYTSFDHISGGWFGGTPYGQVDLVPVEAEADFLNNYKLLVFLGWNTMTAGTYDKLLSYVKKGGCLFMALPHTFTHKKYVNLCPEILFNKGNLSDLFGVKIQSLVMDDAREEIGLGDSRNPLQGISIIDGTKYKFKKGKQYYINGDTRIIKTRLTRARAIARGNNGQPILTRKSFLGGGEAFLLIAPDYPIIYKDLVRDVLTGLIKRHQGDVRLTSGCRDVNYAVYPDGDAETIYLLNTNLEKKVEGSLNIRGTEEPFSLKPAEFKVIRNP